MKCEFISETEGSVVPKILKTAITQVPAHMYTSQQGTGKYRFTCIRYNEVRVSTGSHVYVTTRYE